MEENVFMTGGKVLTLEDYLQYDAGSRGNLGEELPVMVYRLLEYSLKSRLRFSAMPDARRENILQRKC